MRTVLFLAALVAAVFVLDAVVFDGHYGQIVWQEAKYRAEQFNYEVRYFLTKFGLTR